MRRIHKIFLCSLPALLLAFNAYGGEAEDKGADDPYIAGLILYKEKQYDKAIELWRPLAEQKDCDALNGLGMAYLLGKGVAPDWREAVALWTQSAKLGDNNAQLTLADLYFQSASTRFYFCANGACGVKRDYTAAFKWYSVVEKTTSNTAMQRYASNAIILMLNRLTPEEVENVEILVSHLPLLPKFGCVMRKFKLIDYGHSI